MCVFVCVCGVCTCRIDVTEAQLSMMMVHLVSGVCGPEIWRKTVSRQDMAEMFL